jgi:quercetin dioxygenase-like cupin family protein
LGQNKKSFENAIKLINIVDYQQESIVSRTLTDKKNETVTFFAFDEGQGLSEHTTPFDALVFIIDGEAEVSISGKNITVKNGRTSCFESNQKIQDDSYND